MSLASITSTAEKWMGPIFILSMVAGLLLPLYTSFLNSYITIMIMIVLFVSFLKVDFGKIAGYARHPLLLIYILAVSMILIPAAIFLAVSQVQPDLAVGFLLMFAVPTAATNPVLADIFKGNVSFSLLLQFLTYAAAPFTLPILAYYLAGSAIPVDPFTLFISMVQIIIIPLVAAQIFRRFSGEARVDKIRDWTSMITILVLALSAVGIMGANSAFFFENIYSVFIILAVLFPMFALMLVIGYYMAWWMKKEDRMTISINKAYLNGGLAIVLAAQFFGPKAVLVAVANIAVWYSFLAIHKRFVK